MKKVLGCTLLSLPFVVLTIKGINSIGLLPMLGVYTTTAAIVACVVFGVKLIHD